MQKIDNYSYISYIAHKPCLKNVIWRKALLYASRAGRAVDAGKYVCSLHGAQAPPRAGGIKYGVFPNGGTVSSW